MKLSEILTQIEYVSMHGKTDGDIKGITEDSRKIKSGDAFMAIRGFHADGHLYIKKAVENGARVVFHEREVEYIDGITYIQITKAREVLSKLSALIYGNATKEMHVIGVTGTNGKTTCTYMLRHLYDALGKNSCAIGTNGIILRNKKLETQNTTPSASELMQTMRDLKDEYAITHIMIEVSSHAMALHRVDDVCFDTTIFTNLTIEHLDLHGTMENYYQAKKMLFTKFDTTRIVNIDDPYGKRLASEVSCVTYGEDSTCDYRISEISQKGLATNFQLTVRGTSYPMRLPILGTYNVYNACACIAAAHEDGYAMEEIIAAMQTFEGAEGRFEIVQNEKGKNIIIDFAHSPDALEKLLQTVTTEGKKILVFGLSGDRVPEIRYEMGQKAAQYSDLQIVTEDDPNYANVDEISEGIIRGIISKNGTYRYIKDRMEAVSFAIEKATGKDVVILAGKGHEVGMKYFGKREGNYNERKTVESILKDL